jgi:hypothetical protein
MTSESGCRQTRYAFLALLAGLGLVIWLIVRFTGQNNITITDKS